LPPAWIRAVNETILVNRGPRETRVVTLERGAVRDIYIERDAGRGIVGNIYLGKVVRVMPGMQAAFVDFGAERTGLLHISDLSRPKPRRGARREQAIENQLHDGQKLAVQVIRDPLGSKGARLSAEVSLSSRFLVFLPHSDRLAVSQRVEGAGERARLLLLLQEGLGAEGLAGEGGYILRTAAEGVDLDGLRSDLRFLNRLWAAICRRREGATGPQLLYEELPLHLRVARDLATPDLAKVLVDQQSAYLSLCSFCEDYVPEMRDRLEYYSGAGSLFDRFGAEEELQRALSHRVDLDCGGYLVIDQTEAMTVIDVNTGSFLGRRNVDETVFRTNLEAAAALARQLRLRNLGGIIVVDFIDMADQEHRRQVQQALQEALQLDPVRTTCGDMSELSLVAMTRKRSGESLQHILCEDCPVCQGQGVLKSARTVCYEIFREIGRAAPASDCEELVVVAAQPVISLLQSDEAGALAELEAATGKTVRLRPEPRYGQEHFDIAML